MTFHPCPCSYCTVELQPLAGQAQCSYGVPSFSWLAFWAVSSLGSSPLMKLKHPWSIALLETHFTGLDLEKLSQLCHLVKLITSLQFLEPFSGGHSNLSKLVYFHSIHVLGQLFRTNCLGLDPARLWKSSSNDQRHCSKPHLTYPYANELTQLSKSSNCITWMTQPVSVENSTHLTPERTFESNPSLRLLKHKPRQLFYPYFKY